MWTRLSEAVARSMLAAGSWLRPQAVRVEVEVAGLPAELDGFAIAHLTDFHRSPLVPNRLVERGVRVANAMEPDLVVLTGDFVSVSSRFAVSCARALGELKAEHGVYAVLGNHDHWEGGARVASELEANGITMLTNASVAVERDGARFWLVGIDDLIAGEPCLDTALLGVPQDEPRILLCHEPDFAPEAASHGFALQLSGHTHGGQLDLPVLGRAVLPDMGVLYPAGLHRVSRTDTYVYTNVGLGVVTAPLRYRCPPEVALITLRASL